jgi:hypothetical protein
MDLVCPRCIFTGSSLDELLEHYGEYHQVLDYYVAVARDPELGRQAPQQLEWSKLMGERCALCGFRYQMCFLISLNQKKGKGYDQCCGSGMFIPDPVS